MGRPKKGMSRMDAALDHMQQMGFSKPDIRAAAKDLLKVYGDDGWVFLEEGAYKLLLDTLLERAGEGDENENENEDRNGNENEIQNENENENENGNETGEVAEDHRELVLRDEEVQGSSAIGEECDRAMVVEQICHTDTKEQTGEQQDENSSLLNEDAPQVPVEPSSFDSFALTPIVPVNQETRGEKHKPCFGWFVDDDNDDDGNVADNVMVAFVPSE